MWVIAAFGKFASVFKLRWRMAFPPNGAFGSQTVLSAFAAATQLLPQIMHDGDSPLHRQYGSA